MGRGSRGRECANEDVCVNGVTNNEAIKVESDRRSVADEGECCCFTHGGHLSVCLYCSSVD